MQAVPSRAIQSFATAALLLLSGACSANPGPIGNPVQDHMYAHFAEAGRIQTAVIFGDPDGARTAARRLSTHDEPDGLPPTGLPYLEAMRRSARRIAGDISLRDAAFETARLGAACGGCHQVSGRGPVFRADGLEGAAAAETMVRHIQGADRLWEGLIGPSDGAWEAGAALLATGSVDVDAVEARPGRESMFAEVFRLGRQAQEVEGQEERARVYGEVLATCSGCHTAG